MISTVHIWSYDFNRNAHTYALTCLLCCVVWCSARVTRTSKTNGCSPSRVPAASFARLIVRSLRGPRFSSASHFRRRHVLFQGHSSWSVRALSCNSVHSVFGMCVRPGPDDPRPLEDPVICGIAAAHERSPAQVRVDISFECVHFSSVIRMLILSN